MRVGYLLISFVAFCCFHSNVLASEALSVKVQQLQQELNGQIGVAVLEVATQKLWGVNKQQYFPLMSTFKPLACAKLLLDVQRKRLHLDDVVQVEKELLVSYSPVTGKLVGKSITLGQSCEASVSWSDNTAANIILQYIGGPKGLTEFMRSIGDEVTRLDRIEPQLNQALAGDVRDTTTPEAMVYSLQKLLFTQVLSQTSRQWLRTWMLESKTSTNLLRSILPQEWRIADKTGYGDNGSRAITAVIWLPDQSAHIIALYLTQTKASLQQLNQAIVELGQVVVKQLQVQGKTIDDKH